MEEYKQIEQVDKIEQIVKMKLNTKMKVMYVHSFYEEDLPFDPNLCDESIKDSIIIYPRSYIEKTSKISKDKYYDYNFVGSVFFPDVYSSRKWILKYVKNNFTDKSYFALTDVGQQINLKEYDEVLESKLIGSFDYTHLHFNSSDMTFVPVPLANCNKYDDYIYFDEKYYQILSKSKFTLCPAGDAPWSMRFFEAIMCKSIPVLEISEHSGRNQAERDIGYHFYTKDEEHVYREDWAEENYKKFIKFQTLLN